MTVIAPDCGVHKQGTCIYWWHTIIINSCTYRDKRSCKKQNIKTLSRDLELNYYHSLLSLVIAKDNLLMCRPLVILSYIDSPLIHSTIIYDTRGVEVEEEDRVTILYKLS